MLGVDINTIVQSLAQMLDISHTYNIRDLVVADYNLFIKDLEENKLSYDELMKKYKVSEIQLLQFINANKTQKRNGHIDWWGRIREIKQPGYYANIIKDIVKEDCIIYNPVTLRDMEILQSNEIINVSINNLDNKRRAEFLGYEPTRSEIYNKSQKEFFSYKFYDLILDYEYMSTTEICKNIVLSLEDLYNTKVPLTASSKENIEKYRALAQEEAKQRVQHITDKLKEMMEE